MSNREQMRDYFSALNLTKVGNLRVTYENNLSEYEKWDGYGNVDDSMNHWFRGHAFKYGLDVKKLKKLEIPFDINCPGCREFVEQEKKNLSLEHLILVLTRHEEDNITIMLKKGFKTFERFQNFHQWPSISSGGYKHNFVFQQSMLFIRNTVKQMENLAKQKLRNYLWMRSYYNSFFDKTLLLRLRQPKFLVGGAILCNKNTGFDWKSEKICESESQNYFGHIDQCAEIKNKTITCKVCGNRLRIEGEMANITYCQCKDTPKSVYGVKDEDCDWIPFIERKDIIVWRRPHKTMKGNYEYKMYGNFDDVSADEFLSVQLDMSEFRMSWDESTAQCVVIDQNTDTSASSDSIVYYWEVNWPRFFSNRDYCCYREHSHDSNSGTFLVLSKSVDHPKCPVKKKTWRVQDYFSVLVVKPHTTSDKPGLEFCLTGYENPGLQLPEAIITYVAVRGMPEFMINLRAACLKLRDKQNVHISTPVVTRRDQADLSKESSKMYQDSYQLGQSTSQPMYA